jgi:cytochrome c oxidase subunit IV
MRQSHLHYEGPKTHFRSLGFAIIVISPAAYVVAIVIANAWPAVSLVIYAVVPLVYFVVVTLVRSAAPSESAETAVS